MTALLVLLALSAVMFATMLAGPIVRAARARRDGIEEFKRYRSTLADLVGPDRRYR